MTATRQPQAKGRFAEVAERLGPGFANTAAESDRSGRFVAENYVLMREHRLMSAGVPSELGGGGASYPELCEMLRILGQHCSSTALALSMHTHLVAAAVWRHRHGQPAEALLRKIAGGELVLVSTGAGDWIDSVGRAEKVEGGYRVSAKKRFGSGSPAGDLLMTSAPFNDPQAGAQVLHFAVALAAEGVRVCDDWDTLGMRATGSNTVELEDVFVPEESVSVRRAAGVWHPSFNVVSTIALPILMSAYLGVAERAAELARASAKARGVDAVGMQVLGELENALVTAQMAHREMVENANDYDFAPVNEKANRSLICKTITSNAVLTTAQKAIELVGGGALFRNQPFERLLRDMQGAPFHPLPEKKQLQFTARVVLGLDPHAG
jgi:alkylation response protein AidB-like acyl-CoA dehydrogenase